MAGDGWRCLASLSRFFFFCNDTATTEIYTLSLHDALPIPPLPYAGNSAYRKVRDRASYAFAVVSVAAALDVAGDRVRDARLAIGAVAPVPWRARTAERVLAGRPATAEWFGRAADAEL